MSLKTKYLLKKLLKRASKEQIIYNTAFKKNNNNKEKHLEVSLFYTCVPKISIIWSTIPEM